MADNFDVNVARRKPNTAEKPRPIHPWDIPVNGLPTDGPEEDAPAPRESAPPAAVPPAAPTAPSAQETAAAHVPDARATAELPSVPVRPAAAPETASRHTAPARSTGKASPARGQSSLSDAINIHSNYCKLDNDVSDALLPRLSASAQSVYLRLYRQSYGWNRNWAAESLPKLTEFCNLSLQTVRKAIKELEMLACIRKEFSDYHKATVYRVFLPSEIGLGKSGGANSGGARAGGLDSDTPGMRDSASPSKNLAASGGAGQDSAPDGFRTGDYQIPDGNDADIRGSKNITQSVFFRGSSVYNILESGGPLPKNIQTHITDTHVAGAVAIVDEFYDSIGFSVVSRSLYRKSLLDYFEMIGSGFSADDIRYAVRWTFQNSRSRPESFSLIKHTLHLAMDDFIQELKSRSAEKAVVQEKQAAVDKTVEWRNRETARGVSPEDLALWREVVEDLRASLNEHSFAAFIEPLRLDEAGEGTVVISAPPDSVSWVNDHYAGRIADAYRDRAGRDVAVEVR